MSKLIDFAQQIKSLREDGQKKIPVRLQKKILKIITEEGLDAEEAASSLNIHPVTISKWRRKIKKKEELPSFIEVAPSKPSPVVLRQLPFIELDLGDGKTLRIFK